MGLIVQIRKAAIAAGEGLYSLSTCQGFLSISGLRFDLS